VDQVLTIQSYGFPSWTNSLYRQTGHILSDGDPLDLIERQLILPAVVQLGRFRRLVAGHSSRRSTLLRELAATTFSNAESALTVGRAHPRGSLSGFLRRALDPRGSGQELANNARLTIKPLSVAFDAKPLAPAAASQGEASDEHRRDFHRSLALIAPIHCSLCRTWPQCYRFHRSRSRRSTLYYRFIVVGA
jgi:hypothetical protein